MEFPPEFYFGPGGAGELLRSGTALSLEREFGLTVSPLRREEGVAASLPISVLGAGAAVLVEPLGAPTDVLFEERAEGVLLAGEVVFRLLPGVATGFRVKLFSLAAMA